MNALLWLTILCLLLFALYGWYNSKKTPPLTLETFEEDDESTMLIKSVLDDIETKTDERNWFTYHILPTKEGMEEEKTSYPFLLQNDENETKYVIDISINEEGHHKMTVLSDDKPVLEAMEETPYSGDYKGSVFGVPFKMSYRRRKERITILHGNNKVKITGYGVNAHSKGLPAPWYEAAPLVFKRDRKPIGLIFYKGKASDLPIDTKRLALELIVPEEENHKVPLYFFIYSMMQEMLWKRSIFQ